MNFRHPNNSNSPQYQQQYQGYQTNQAYQGYHVGSTNDSRGIAKFDRIMNKIHGVHKNTDDEYYQAIA